MKPYPKHAAPKRRRLGRMLDMLMPHSMAFLGQGVPMRAPQRSHVRLITADMVIDQACAEIIAEQRALRDAPK